MSDGAYRDDHDAALARVDALEQELAEAKGEHARVEQLERELAKVKAERDRLKAFEPTPSPPPVRIRIDTPDPIDERGKLVAGFVVFAMLFAVAVAAFLITRHGSDPGARAAQEERTAAQQLEEDMARTAREYAVMPCIDEAAALTAAKLTDEIGAILDDDATCLGALGVAVDDPRLGAMHDQLLALVQAMNEISVVRDEIKTVSSNELPANVKTDIDVALGHLHTAANALRPYEPDLRRLTNHPE